MSLLPRCLATLVVFWGGISLNAAETQNPSPMVEHTRKHERLAEDQPAGRREQVGAGTFFLPQKVDLSEPVPLLVFFHGGPWLPEVAASKTGRALLRFQSGTKTGSYAEIAGEAGKLRGWLDAARQTFGAKFSSVTVAGWSAGCQAIRELLQDEGALPLIDGMICIDGIHASYVDGLPGPLESKLEISKLQAWLAFAKEAVAGRKRMLIVHSEIFPGTFASTTETADWLLHELAIPRQAVLAWGPRGTQQLSQAQRGNFHLHGYAGNSAPDHVDLLHSLPEWIELLEKSPVVVK